MSGGHKSYKIFTAELHREQLANLLDFLMSIAGVVHVRSADGKHDAFQDIMDRVW